MEKLLVFIYDLDGGEPPNRQDKETWADYNLLLIRDDRATWLMTIVNSLAGINDLISDGDTDEHLRAWQEIKSQLEAGSPCIITPEKDIYCLYVRTEFLNKKALLGCMKFFLQQTGYLQPDDKVQFFWAKPC